MRETKFRYVYQDGISKAIFTRCFDLDQIEGGDQFDEISDNPILKNYMVISRDEYTGMKDKNGVEIYEGDIVRNFWTCKYKDSGKPPTYTVVFEDGSFQFWADPKHGNYKCVSKTWWACEHSKPDNWEVIGNIHQDSHLLGETK